MGQRNRLGNTSSSSIFGIGLGAAKSNIDPTFHGKEEVHIDKRTCYDATETDWHKHIVYSEEYGQPMVPLDVVNSVILENEHLRESLYVNQGHQYNRSIEKLLQLTGESTSYIVRTVNSIERLTRGKLESKRIFSLMYVILARYYQVDFKAKRVNESKLQYLWRTGNLPLICMMVNVLRDVVYEFCRASPAEMGKVFHRMSNPPKFKSKNIRMKQKPPF